MLSVWCAPVHASVFGALGFGLLCVLHYSCLPKTLLLDYALCFLQEGKENYGFAGIFCKWKRTPALSALTRAKVLEEDDGGVSRGDWGSHQRTSFNLSMLGIELGRWFFHWHSVQVHTPI